MSEIIKSSGLGPIWLLIFALIIIGPIILHLWILSLDKGKFTSQKNNLNPLISMLFGILGIVGFLFPSIEVTLFGQLSIFEIFSLPGEIGGEIADKLFFPIFILFSLYFSIFICSIYQMTNKIYVLSQRTIVFESIQGLITCVIPIYFIFEFERVFSFNNEEEFVLGFIKSNFFKLDFGLYYLIALGVGHTIFNAWTNQSNLNSSK